MDDAQSNGQQSSLDSLRTVEFRQTLRGYHIDDVDEYLERVAIEADALQEEFRQTTDQLRQAVARIAELEERQYEEIVSPQGTGQFAAVSDQPSGQVPAQASSSQISDETLQRTLLLAQKFVDETKADAELQAKSLLERTEDQVRSLIAEAEQQAKSLAEDAGRHLQDEVDRLQSLRDQLSSETTELGQRLLAERARIQSSLSDIATWLDSNLSIGADVSAAAENPQNDARSQHSSGTLPAPGLQPFTATQFTQNPDTNKVSVGAPVSGQAEPADGSPATLQTEVTPGDEAGRTPQQAANGNLF